jgi:hypothetical protein
MVNKNFIFNDFGFEKNLLSYITFDGSKVEMVTGHYKQIMTGGRHC